MVYELMSNDYFWILILTIYALSVTFLTKWTYKFMLEKGLEKDDAIYYNRKLVHIFAGGIIAIIVPIVFSSSFYPLLCGLAITLLTFLTHKRGESLYWFQTNDNLNDVTFCFMWGFSIFFLWELMGYDFRWVAIIPASFMAFGDGVTGIVRNSVFKKRFKHPLGNICMAIVCVPLGYILADLSGMAIGGFIAGFSASIVERYEFGPIDDNILITICSSIVLYLYFLIT
jgi:hypothetical protein